MSSLKSSIEAVLPSLSLESTSNLIKCLDDAGVETEEDLRFLQEADLASVLKPIQIRKLLKAWKTEDSTPNLPSPGGGCFASSATSPSTPPARRESQVTASSCPNGPLVTHTVNANWAAEFQVPWETMGPACKKNLQEGLRLHPSDRRSMIRTVIDSVRQRRSSPSWKACETIAKAMVKKYPKSLEDQLQGEKIGTGYFSIAKQLLNRWENVNRVISPGKAVKQRQSGSVGSVNSDDPSPPKKRDKYGCINWQPQSLPEGQTEHSQATLKQELKEMADQDSGEDSKDVKEKMALTYYSQRCDINGGASVHTLLNDWPYLFTKKGMSYHFQNLIGMDLETTMTSTLSIKSPRVQAFMKSLTKKEICNILEDTSSANKVVGNWTPEQPGMILCIMAYFGEDSNHLFQVTDKTSTASDVEKLPLPSTPCVVACGDSLLTSRLFMLTADKIVINDNIPLFETALKLLMASFYCLNIQYPEGAASTLEFIQRCFLRINPDGGSKVSRGNAKSSSMSKQVVGLINRMADYEWTSD